MPILSGTLTDAGSASVSGVGAGTASAVLFSFGTAAAAGAGSNSAAAAPGVLTAAGSASSSLVGAGVRTAIAASAYTYNPAPASTFLGAGGGGGGGTGAGNSVFRRNPPPTISGNLGTTQSKMTVRVGGSVTPLTGQDVQVDFGDGFGTLFAGTIQSVTQVFEGRPTRLAWDIVVVDYMWLLAGDCPRACFAKVSATAIVQSLMSTYGPGFTVVNVQAALPAVSVTFTGSKNLVDCLQEIANLVGGCYMYVDSAKDLHFFQTETTNPPDQLNNTTNTTLLFNPPITYERDGSQRRNRVSVSGASTQTTSATAVGANEIAVTNTELFQNGGQAIVGCQVLSFSGIRLETPAVSQPAPTPTSGGGTASGSGGVGGSGQLAPAAFDAHIAVSIYSPPLITNGRIHLAVRYALTFVTATGGETTMSEIVYPIQYGLWSAQPGNIHTVAVGGAGSVPAGINISYAVSFYTATGETELFSCGSVNLGVPSAVDVSIGAVTDDRILGAHIWRSKGANTLTHFLVGTSVGTAARTFTDTLADAVLGKLAPLNAFGVESPNTTGCQVELLNIPLNGTRARKLWRSTSDLYSNYFTYSPWTLLATLTNPSQATYTDNAETQRQDQYLHDGNAGTITIGGGLSGGATPTNAVNPGTPTPVQPPVAPAPSKAGFLIGVSGIGEAIPAGASVALYAQVDDINSQKAWAAKMGGSGIRSMPLIQEARLTTSAMLYAFAQSVMDTFSSDIEIVRYSTRDTKSRAGKTIDIALTNPPITTTLKIQTVQMDLIRYSPTRPPRYAVTASSVKYTLQDLLQKVLLGL